LYCFECGTAISDDSKYCQKCGAAQEAVGTRSAVDGASITSHGGNAFPLRKILIVIFILLIGTINLTVQWYSQSWVGVIMGVIVTAITFAYVIFRC
jgi:uncharacterized membrane protein YvbJ